MNLAHASATYEFEPLAEPRLDEIAQLEQRVHAHPWTRRNFVDAITAGYESRLLCDQGRVIGYFIAMKGVDEVHLLNITVAPEHQGQGWGRLLLDVLRLWANGCGAQWVWLEVRASNQRAMRVYERYGMRRVGERKDYYPSANCQREHAVVMCLKL